MSDINPTSLFEQPEDLEKWRDWMVAQIEVDREAVTEEIGEFEVIEQAGSVRFLLRPADAEEDGDWFVAYPSHYGADARLVIDDYAYELGVDRPDE